MRYSLVVAVLIISQHGALLSLAAPSPGNEIDFGPNEDIKVFRESYAVQMKSFMNSSIDPCDDFYLYACGNYPNVIEDIELISKQNRFNDLSHETNEIIDQILSKKRQPSEEHYEELQKVKHFVEICNDAELWPLKPSEEYLTVIKMIGGFPAVDASWNASAFNWFNMTAHLVRYGIVGLVKEDVFLRQPFPPIFEIAKFGFGFDVYSDNIMTNYSLGYVHNADMMKRLLKIYGVTGPKANKVIEEIIDFWREALVYQNKASEGCGDIEEGTFSQWNSFYEIAWNLKDFSAFDFPGCPCDFYFIELNKIATNRPEAFANFMALKFLFTMIPQVKSSKYQHQHCVTQAKQGMSMVLTHFFMKEHFGKEVQQEVEEMISEISKSFTLLIETSDWLDEPTRFGIQDVLKTLKSTVGQVDDPISDSYIHQTMKLNLTNNYAANNLELAKFQVDLNRYAFLNSNTINSTVSLEILKAINANAFYDNTEHSINVLAGILFTPMYHRFLPKSIKYGGLGFIIGHEIVHSIDPRGRFGEKHYKAIHEWSKKSKINMKTNSQCFIEHHSNFTVPVLNIKLKGKESLTETICDSGGLRGSLAAYRRVLKNAARIKDRDFERMESLPGLDFTPDQLFFINFAQVYCAKYEPRHYWSEIYSGYPMDRLRVILPLQNFDEFSTVFACPLNSPMNPSKKCRMW